MQISKRSVAREWLIFLALFPFGFGSCYFLGYHRTNFRDLYFSRSFFSRHWNMGNAPYNTPWDAFWNDAFGLTNLQSLALWLVPYFAVTVFRSISWSIKMLNAKE